MPDQSPAAPSVSLGKQQSAAASAPPSDQPSPLAIAPLWHTVIVLCVMLGVSLLGARLQLPAVRGLPGRVSSYLFAMLIEWATVALMWWGVSRRGITWSDLIGGRWQRRIDVLLDLGIGIAFIVVFGGAVQLLGALLHAAPPQALRAMMPHTALEMLLWVLLSLTGGFCEEVIFRGYLQRQFSALTHAVAGGIVLQALAFGLSHGYQGWKLMALIALYGVCFGWLAHWRGSLRPGMLGHAVQDIAAGLLARVL